MSKVKHSKKKCVTNYQLASKSCDIKTESDSRITTDNESSSFSYIAAEFSGNKTSKLEGSCYESSVNFSSGRELTADYSSDYMKNSILEEVLNEKKAALLQSPEVMKLFREEQLKRQSKNRAKQE